MSDWFAAVRPKHVPQKWIPVLRTRTCASKLERDGVSKKAILLQRKLERTMSHSLIGAGRTTHLKILCVALLGAIAVVAVGTTARVVESERTEVVKAGKPATFTERHTTTVR
jgi:hypothetical protein